MNVRITSWVAERPKTYDLRKLGNFKKISKMFGCDGVHPVEQPKAIVWRILIKHCKQSAVKDSIGKSISLCLQTLVQDCSHVKYNLTFPMIYEYRANKLLSLYLIPVISQICL